MVETFVSSMVGILSGYGILAGIILIMIESIIPALPLSLFITLNIASYGNVIGFIISWLATVVGCMISFYFFRKILRKRFNKFIKKNDITKLDNLMNSISDMSFSNLVMLIALPFSPAFLINIASALSKISVKKFFFAILIGKMMMVYFWGYVGCSLLESITDYRVIIKVLSLLLASYFLSKIVSIKLDVK